MCGHPIDVEKDSDFITLYHVFQRIPESAKYQMLRKRVGPSRWYIFVLPEAEFALMQRLGGVASEGCGPSPDRS